MLLLAYWEFLSWAGIEFCQVLFLYLLICQLIFITIFLWLISPYSFYSCGNWLISDVNSQQFPPFLVESGVKLQLFDLLYSMLPPRATSQSQLFGSEVIGKVDFSHHEFHETKQSVNIKLCTFLKYGWFSLFMNSVFANLLTC